MTKVIDISSWQDASTLDIDFNAVKDSGVVGVMIKFTQGIDYTNPKAKHNADKARAAGLLIGAYHVGEITKNSAEHEAEYFLRAIDGEAIDFATALDIESYGTAVYPQTKDWCEKWLSLVKGRSPNDLIYLNKYLFDQSAGAPWGYGLWAAQFVPDNGVSAFMVQGAAVPVKGINGNTDVSTITHFRTVNAADPTSHVTHIAVNHLPFLDLGDTGLAVKLLQTLLRSHSHNIAVDGIYGAKTVQAVKDFQSFEHLVPDGITGTLTWEALSPSKAVAAEIAAAPVIEQAAATTEPAVSLAASLNADGTLTASLNADGTPATTATPIV